MRDECFQKLPGSRQCQSKPTKDGRVFIVEYKGAHLTADPSQREKRRVGELWARASKGKGIFIWAMKQDEAGRDVRGQLRSALLL